VLVCTLKAFVGVTDNDWYNFLASQPQITEVNFWKPGGAASFQALQPGEPFIFKTHWPHNSLVGGGHFEGFVRLPLSTAWEFFGTGNGVASLEMLREQVGKYRRQPIGQDDDPEIGCVLLNEVKFLSQASIIAAPDDFSKHVVQGKGYEIGVSGSNAIIDLFVKQLMISVDSADSRDPRRIDGPVFGEPRLVRQRLGQGGFQALVLNAYQKRCSITHHKIAPTLQAAHIKPVSKGGENRLDNGILLRSDVHTMFDRGYLGVTPKFELQVSLRLREEFGNGEEFYAKQGEIIRLPQHQSDRPNSEFLEWHMDEVFKVL